VEKIGRELLSIKIEAGQSLALDTNILLDATDMARPSHQSALSLFQSLSRRRILLILATQVIREYLVVATRPEKNNGLGLPIHDAMRQRAAIIPETVQAGELMEKWALQFRTTGKKLHDLQLLATIHQAGIGAVLTSNPSDFPKNTGVQIFSLRDIPIDALTM
jgi:predicted nucleic acid-binding protein